MLALSPRVLKLTFKELQGQRAWQLAGIKLWQPSEGTHPCTQKIPAVELTFLLQIFSAKVMNIKLTCIVWQVQPCQKD